MEVPLNHQRQIGCMVHVVSLQQHVVSWIVHSVSTSIQQSILWMDKAEEIWRDLNSRYL